MNSFITKILLPFIVSYFLTYFSSVLLLKKASILVCKTKPELEGFHSKKENTPNIGGIAFISSAVISSLIFAPKSFELFYIIALVLCFGLLGFVDDFYKKDSDNGDGIISGTKLLWQFIIAIVFIIFGTSKNLISSGLPFLMGEELLLKIIENIFLIFLMVYFVNAFNITDGLDGLVGFVSLPLCLVLIVASLFIKNNEVVFTLLMSLTAALLAFLKFNKYPAKYFMGDCGSMALGSLLVIIVFVLKISGVFIIASMMLSIELISSLIQIISIRIFNQKVFTIAPIHHMYEEKGESESSIVSVFFKISTLFSVIALLLFYYWYIF